MKRKLLLCLVVLCGLAVGCAARKPTSLVLPFSFAKASGVTLLVVEKGSSADALGFEAGDVIKAIDGTPVTNWDEFQRALPDREALVTLSVWRADTHHEIEVLLSKQTTDKLGVVLPALEVPAVELPKELQNQLLDKLQENSEPPTTGD